MIKVNISLLFLLVSILIIGCSSEYGIPKSDSDTKNNEMENIYKPLPYTIFETYRVRTDGKQLEEVEVTIIHDYKSFKALYQKLTPNQSGSLDFNELDFSQGSALFIDLGNKTTTGYEIHIAKVLSSNDNTLLELRSLYPGKGCIVGMAHTRPSVLAFVNKKIDKLTTNVVEYARDC